MLRFWLRCEKPHFLGADVEASRADEGAALSGRTKTGCTWPSYWRSGRWTGRWWVAPRLQWEVVCGKRKTVKMSITRVKELFKTQGWGEGPETTWSLNTWRRGVFILWGWFASTKQVTRIWKDTKYKSHHFKSQPVWVSWSETKDQIKVGNFMTTHKTITVL